MTNKQISLKRTKHIEKALLLKEKNSHFVAILVYKADVLLSYYSIQIIHLSPIIKEMCNKTGGLLFFKHFLKTLSIRSSRYKSIFYYIHESKSFVEIQIRINFGLKYQFFC